MINGRLEVAELFSTSSGVKTHFVISYKENKKEKAVESSIIDITSVDSLAAIMAITEAKSWDRVANSPVQFEIKDNLISTLANFKDPEIFVNFIPNTKTQDEVIENEEEINV